MGPILRLAGKVALVTGGGSGIGEATAKLFAEEGARVMVADIASERGLRVAQEIGVTAKFVQCDVRKEEEVEAAVGAAVRELGALHILATCVGMRMAAVPIEQVSREAVDEVWGINVMASVAAIKYASKAITPFTQGSIVCAASAAGTLAIPHNAAFNVSNFALQGLVRAAAVEFAASGIRVNSVSAHPSFHVPGAHPQSVTAHDIAQAILFLASPLSSRVNGHNLLLDSAWAVSKDYNPFALAQAHAAYH